MVVTHRGPLVAALDIGTTKIVALLAEPIFFANGSLRIRPLEYGTSRSAGMVRATVVSIDDLAEAITSAVRQCESHSRRRLREVYVGVAGNHTISQNFSLTTTLDNPERGIRERDVRRLIRKAVESAPVPRPGYRHNTTIIKGFRLNEESPVIESPIGLHGTSLTVDLHLIYGHEQNLTNLISAVERAGLVAKALVPECYASALAVLDENMRRNGALLLDIGGGTTDVAVYHDGALHYTGAVAYAGDIITRDIQKVFNTTPESAEQVKLHYGLKVPGEPLNSANKFRVIDAHSRTEKLYNMSELQSVIDERVREIFGDVRSLLVSEGVWLPPRGIVLTGGGALLHGLEDVVATIFEAPDRGFGRPSVSVAKPIVSTEHELLSSAVYSTAIGLAYYGAGGRDFSAALAHLMNGRSWTSRILQVLGWGS